MLRYTQHDKRNAHATVTLSKAKGLARPEREMLRYAQHDRQQGRRNYRYWTKAIPTEVTVEAGLVCDGQNGAGRLSF